MTALKDVGAVIVIYQQDGSYPALVQVLLTEGIPPHRIVLVHNPVNSESLPLITEVDSAVGVLRMPHNVGYAAAMNAGIRQHLERGACFLLLLTPDVRLQAGGLRTLLSAVDENRFGILAPDLYWPRDGSWFSRGGRRRPNGRVDHIRQGRPNPGEQGIAECDWVDGAVMLVRADVFRQVGLFDERFFLYFEETEFCLRVTRAGWKVGVVVGAVAEHEPGGSRRQGAYDYLMARNGLEYARRAAGVRGVSAVLLAQVRENWSLIRILASPRTERQKRRLAGVRLNAMWLGTAAFALRRWGPPPSGLPGLGDVQGTRKRQSHPRIALVSTFPPRRDGIARYAEQLAEDLAHRGDLVMIGLPGSRADRVVRLDGGLRPLCLARATRRRDELLVMWHPDFYISGRVWSRIAAYVSLGFVLRTRGGRVVVHEPDRVVEPGEGLLRRTAARLERTSQRWWWTSGELLFHSESERDAFVGQQALEGRARTSMVAHGHFFRPYAIATRVEARRALGIAREGPLFLCIGFLGPHKGFDRAVHAFTALPEGAARLYLVGSALYDTDEIAGYAAHLHGLVRRVPGAYLVERFVEDAEFDLWVQAADAVLAPYRSATSSSVVARARLLGTRVVATPVSALPEQLGPGDVLVESDEELAGALGSIVGLTRVRADG